MEISRLGISGITTNSWSLLEDVNALKRHGLRNLGLWLYKCQDLNTKQIMQLMREEEINLSNVCFAGLFTGNTLENRREAIKQAKKAIEFTREIEAECLLIVSGPIGNHTLDVAMGYVREALQEICDYADKLEVHLGLEALHPMSLTEHSVINKLEIAVELVNELDSEYLGVFLDTYNIGWDNSYQNWIPKCAGKIKGVHLADWRNPTRSFNDRVLPGQGVLPVEDIIRVIEQTGYTGSYDLEIFSDELWTADYDEIIRDVKEWFSCVKLEDSL